MALDTISKMLKYIVATTELGIQRDFLIRGAEFSEAERKRLWFLQWSYRRGMVTEWPKENDNDNGTHRKGPAVQPPAGT